MATVEEVIYSIKNLAYGGLSTQESTISDSQILYWCNVERSFLIKEEFEKNKLLSPGWKQSLGCVQVQCVDKVDCCDLIYGSDQFIYRTVEKVPIPVSINWSALHSNVLLTYVGLVTYDTPFEFTSESISNWSKYNRWTPNKPRSFYRDGYIYITNIKNPSHLEYIGVQGVFENPEQVLEYNKCRDQCTNEQSEYPLASHLGSLLQQLVLDKWLRPLLAGATDYVNNAQDPKVRQ